MFKQSALGNIGIGAGVIGLIALIFGILWMTVIYSRYEVVPSDLERIVELEGEYTVVDPFATTLQQNATLSGLLASGAGACLLADPQVMGLLGGPAVQRVIGNPQLLALVQSQRTLQTIASPAVGALLSNGALLQALADPTVLAALLNPAAPPALLTHPVLGPMLADPTIGAMLQDPAILSLLGSGLIGTLAGDPELLALLQSPTLGPLPANPAVQALLADQPAFALLLDPRTQQILANPANLPVITVPMLIHRERLATRNDGDKLFLNETVTTTNLATGGTLAGFEPTEVEMIVDRSSKAYLEGTGGGRTGQWALPFHVSKDEVYEAYLTVARQPLPFSYDGTEDTLGLESYRYVTDSTNVPLGVSDPATGLPLVVDANVVAWVEPNTGGGLNATDLETVSAVDPAGNNYTRFVSNIAYTDATVAARAGGRHQPSPRRHPLLRHHAPPDHHRRRHRPRRRRQRRVRVGPAPEPSDGRRLANPHSETSEGHPMPLGRDARTSWHHRYDDPESDEIMPASGP